MNAFFRLGVEERRLTGSGLGIEPIEVVPGLKMGHKEVCKWFDVCPLKRFYEQRKLNKKWIENYCWRNYSKCIRYKMEDEGIYHPDNMMPDGTIDKNLK